MYSMKISLPEHLRNQAEQLTHFCMKDVWIYVYDKLPLPIMDDAVSERMNIHTSTLDEDILMHELGHIILKMTGYNPRGKRIAGYRVENNTVREQAATWIAKCLKIMPKTPYHGTYKAACTCNTVLEGNVGLEFQTVGKTWNVKKLKKNGAGYDFNGDLGHGTQLFDLNANVHVKTDFTDLEYVTSAVLEINPANGLKSQTAKTNLHNYANTAANFHRKLKTMNLGKSSNGFTVCNVPMNTKAGRTKNKKLLVDGVVGTAVDMIAINPLGTRTAHPQATIGVEFEKIPNLISALKSTSEGEYIHGKTSSAIDQTKQLSTFSSVETNTLMPILSPAGRGLVELIQLNVIQFQKGKVKFDEEHLPINDKSALPLMQRTSFLSYFNALNLVDKACIQSALQNYIDGSTTRFFGLNVKATDLIAGQDNDDGVVTLTFRDWCASFLKEIGGVVAAAVVAGDLLETMDDFDGVSRLYAGSAKLADYGITSPIDIGNTRTGAIMELRALQRGVEPNHWKDVADEVFDLVYRLNKT